MRLWLLLTFTSTLFAQQRLTLEQAEARVAPEYRPLHDGERVIVQGTVAAAPVRLSGYHHLGLQDEAGHGILLEGRADDWTDLQPGDGVEARGVIGLRHGAVVLAAGEVKRISRGIPPVAQPISLSELASKPLQGRLVQVEGRVMASGQNAGGLFVQVGNDRASIKVFLPSTAFSETDAGWSGLRNGDAVQVTGVISLYCPRPPFNRFPELLISSPNQLIVVHRAWLVSPELLGLFAVVLFAILAGWWIRERRMADQRRVQRALYELSEDVLATRTNTEILAKLRVGLSRIESRQQVDLYLWKEDKKTLEKVAVDLAEEPQTISPAEGQDGFQRCLNMCLRDQTVVWISDIRRSSFFRREPVRKQALLLVPLVAGGEVLGVLANHLPAGSRDYSEDERLVMQHLGRQTALALRLHEQASAREQVFRGEKLAAAGQLIAGIAKELREPLEAIAAITDQIASRHDEPGLEREMRAVFQEARRASELVTRLVSFTRADSNKEVKRLDLHNVLAGVFQFRAPEWQARHLTVDRRVASEPITVIAAQGQLEQVFLSLLLHAEQGIRSASEGKISVSTRLLGGRAVVEIAFPAMENYPLDPFQQEPAGEAAGLSVCRAIVRNQGGELRFTHPDSDHACFEVDLPALSSAFRNTRSRSPLGRPMTILFVEPEQERQREPIAVLGGRRAHRVVAVSSSDEAVELVRRFAFDILLCPTHVANSGCLELYERVKNHVGVFAFLTEGYDPNLARMIKSTGALVLARPLQEADLDEFFEQVNARLESRTMARTGR